MNGLNRFVSRLPVRPQDVLLVILGAFLGSLSAYLPFGVLIALSLSVTVVLMVMAEITRVDDPNVAGFPSEPGAPAIGEQELSQEVSAGSMPQGIPLEIDQAIITIIIGPGLTFDSANCKTVITWGLSDKASSNAGVPPGSGGAAPGD